MDLALLFAHLIRSVVAMFKSFSFTMGGVTVNLWDIFIWMLFASFLISVIKKLVE